MTRRQRSEALRRVETAHAEVERLRGLEDAHLAAARYARERHLAAVADLACAYAELELSIDVLEGAQNDSIEHVPRMRLVAGGRR